MEEMQFCAKLKVSENLTCLSGLFLAGFHACLKLQTDGPLEVWMKDEMELQGPTHCVSAGRTNFTFDW